jgi:hypothetical protein
MAFGAMLAKCKEVHKEAGDPNARLLSTGTIRFAAKRANTIDQGTEQGQQTSASGCSLSALIHTELKV